MNRMPETGQFSSSGPAVFRTLNHFNAGPETCYYYLLGRSVGAPMVPDLRLLNRRDFLKTASAATLAALAGGAPRAFAAPSTRPYEEKINPTADTLILL